MSKQASPFVTEIAIPDGTYHGRWGGYEVEMTINGSRVTFRTEDGVRGLNIPVTVVVKDGMADVQAIQRTA